MNEDITTLRAEIIATIEGIIDVAALNKIKALTTMLTDPVFRARVRPSDITLTLATRAWDQTRREPVAEKP